MFSTILAELFGWKHYGQPKKFKRFVINSKEVGRGDLFIPLKGSKFDGHTFIREALDRGAAGFLFERGKIPPYRLKELTEKAFALEVSDTFKALRRIAAYRREQFKGKQIVAVTGTAGKTTTKELIAHLLEGVSTVYKNPGNLNSRIGFPLSLANARGEADFWVFELGASERGNIKSSVSLLKPTASVLTSLGKAHLEGFGNFENLTVAKGEIFLPDTVKVSVLPARFFHLYKTLLRNKRTVTFGEGGDVKVQLYRFTADGQTELVLNGKKYRVNLLGFGVIKAVEAAAALLKALELPYSELLEDRLTTFKGLWGRMQPLRGKGFLVINDAYNANPLSMFSALRTLLEVEGYTRRVAILGDMLELGRFEREEHRRLGRLLDTVAVDEVYLAGKLSVWTCAEVKNKPCHHFYHTEELLRFLRTREPRKDTVYLIKGSRGLKMEKLLEVFIP